MKKLILTLMALLLLPFAYAGALNLYELPQEGGYLDISYPKISTFKLNSGAELKYLIFDENYTILNASAGEVDCQVRIYNDSTDVLYQGDMTDDGVGVKTDAFTNQTGIFHCDVWCNTTVPEYGNGFVSHSYYVTKEGKNYPPGDEGSNALIIIIGVFAISFILLYIAFHIDTEKHFFLQLIILIFVVIMSILIPKTILDFSNNYNTSVTFYKGVLWFVRVFWVYMLFYIMYEFGAPLLKRLRIRLK